MAPEIEHQDIETRPDIGRGNVRMAAVPALVVETVDKNDGPMPPGRKKPTAQGNFVHVAPETNRFRRNT
jgi:hypothetical protein